MFYFTVIYNADGSVNFWTWVIWGAVILSIVGCCLCKVCSNDPDPECIFCKKQYDEEEDWARHKVKCLGRNAPFYSSLPSPFAAHCPGCRQPLKMWTRAGENVRLSCHGKNEMKTTNGENLFICYICDQSVCLDCTQEIASHYQQQQQQGQVQIPMQDIVNDGFAPPPSYAELNKVQQV